MNQFKTVYINGRFLTQKITGTQRYCREVMLALDEELANREEFRVFRWVLLVPSGTIVPKLERIEVESVPGFKGNLWEQWTLWQKSRMSILLSFGMTGPLLHRNQIITVFDASVYRVPDAYSWRFKLWYKFMIRWIVKRSRSIFSACEYAKTECVRYFGARSEQVCVTSAGWQHLDRIEEVSNDEILKLVGNKPFVLAVSSPTPNKNFRLVVEAMQKIGQAPFAFVVAGSVNPAIFGGAQNHSELAKYLGYVTDEQLKALYRKAICFVYPSRYEGFGIPPLEAMSLGCPVLASEIGAVKEVCGDAVTYFDPHSADQLAEKLLAIASAPDAKEVWGKRGMERAKLFSWRNAAKRVADHLVANYQ
ncbi:MAG: glycosyltransferase family 1 protein [Pirellulaceae bacterium]|nr:glycosyltransferase family 1 protein [Pirellulaceae bacterium]